MFKQYRNIKQDYRRWLEAVDADKDFLNMRYCAIFACLGLVYLASSGAWQNLLTLCLGTAGFILLLIFQSSAGAAALHGKNSFFKRSLAAFSAVLISMRWLFLLIGLCRMYLIDTAFIPSQSMMPQYTVGKTLIVDKTVQWRGRIERGDVLTFRYPFADVLFIKRVVAVEGDLLETDDKGLLRVNGKTPRTFSLSQPFEYTVQTQNSLFSSVQNGAAVRTRSHKEAFGKSKYLVLHDKAGWEALRQNNFPLPEFIGKQHCEHFAPRSGKLKCRVPAGFVFVMGDNRTASEDSRYWGFLDKDRIAGRTR